MGEGRIYLGQLDGRMVALDQRTGEVVWSIQAERWEEGLVITSAPLYYDGLVITGFAGAEFAHRGRVKAFRAKLACPLPARASRGRSTGKMRSIGFIRQIT